MLFYSFTIRPQVRASDNSRKKNEKFAGFSGANSRKNRPISRDFSGKNSFRRIFRGKFLEKSADFGGKLRQETISKKQPISLNFVLAIFASI